MLIAAPCFATEPAPLTASPLSVIQPTRMAATLAVHDFHSDDAPPIEVFNVNDECPTGVCPPQSVAVQDAPYTGPLVQGPDGTLYHPNAARMMGIVAGSGSTGTQRTFQRSKVVQRSWGNTQAAYGSGGGFQAQRTVQRSGAIFNGPLARTLRGENVFQQNRKARARGGVQRTFKRSTSYSGGGGRWSVQGGNINAHMAEHARLGHLRYTSRSKSLYCQHDDIHDRIGPGYIQRGGGFVSTGRSRQSFVSR